MPTSITGSTDRALTRFRRLTIATTIATFALVVIGGIVRISDSGLGCGPAGSGIHGWPLCTGKVFPLVGGSTMVEFTHRLVAGLVAVLIVLLAWYAWRRFRDCPRLLRASGAAVGLVFFQAVLGGLTVEYNLDEVLVAVHLGVAMVLLAILLFMYRDTAPEPSPEADAASPALRRITWTAALLVLVTIMVGGYVAGTESHGTVEGPVVGAHTACGTDFPMCGDSLLPFGTDRLMDVQLTHRVMMFLATIAVVWFAVLALARGIRRWPAITAIVLVLLQVLLGAMNVWYGKHAGLIVGHLTLGTLVWAVVVWSGLSYARSPTQPEPVPVDLTPDRDGPEAVRT